MTQVAGMMGSATSPVVIENVNLIINVYNIGNGEISNAATFGCNPVASAKKVVENCMLKRGNNGTSTATVFKEVPETIVTIRERAASHQKGAVLKKDPVVPLGFVAYNNGSVVPFGVLSIATEIPRFGDRKNWKEIRVCLPSSVLADNETDLYCPVSSCREKLAKNKSFDSHIKKHLGLLSENSSSTNHLSSNGGGGGNLPCPLVYYCYDKTCQYNVETAEKSFKAYKNVKQHYKKVHAPKLFVCDMCHKNFSTLKVAETHQLMCGEKYSCSTCNASYNSLEALQTHCRRKSHSYDHVKYKDKRNSLKQESQSHSSVKASPVVPPPPPAPSSSSASSCASATATGRKTRRLPTLLPKQLGNSDAVFKQIQTFCQQAGLKVDYGCQTVCTAFIQKNGDSLASIVNGPSPSTPTSATASSSSAPAPSSTFTHKKRKSTDTQTNIMKFRATCLDQRHNATNTNVDWKTVVTSDSQTQTADTCNPLELSLKSNDSIHLNEFATIKISENETGPSSTNSSSNNNNNKPPTGLQLVLAVLREEELKQEAAAAIASLKREIINRTEKETGTEAKKLPLSTNSIISTTTASTTTTKLEVNEVDPSSSPSSLSIPSPPPPSSSSTSSNSTSEVTNNKTYNGPSLHSEFISFLDPTDSATQTDPDMFYKSGGFGDCCSSDMMSGCTTDLDQILGIDNYNYNNNNNNAYVSVSSTASQTAVESVSSKSLSAEDYEALLNATADEDLNDFLAFSNYIENGISNYNSTPFSSSTNTNTSTSTSTTNDNDLSFDWENLVEEVYRG